MTEPIVVRVNGLMTREDYEDLRRTIKRESQNIIVLPPQSELLYPPNCGWIPITEQEPNTGEHILITVLWEKGVDTAYDDDYEVMEEDWVVGEYEIRKGTATPLVKRIHERTIAWMKMPEPYRRKEE